MDEACAIALTLKIISPNAYRYVRKLRMIPLPCKSTLLKFFKEFQTPPGFLHDVQKLITIKAAKLTPLQKIVVLVFDAIY